MTQGDVVGALTEQAWKPVVGAGSVGLGAIGRWIWDGRDARGSLLGRGR